MKKVFPLLGAASLGAALSAQAASFGQQQVLSATADQAKSVFAADLDGDGDVDVLSASVTDNKVAWYANDGNSGFGTEQIISSSVGGARCVWASDLDADGDFDVLATAPNSSKIVWFANDGNGNFGLEQLVGSGTYSPISICDGDLDGDGDADVLSASSADDTIAWFANDGLGNFGPKQVITTNANSAYHVTAADLDGDGDLDALSASYSDDKVAWYRNDGSGNFGPQIVITTTTDYVHCAQAVDVDGDGDLDVISASGGDSKIAWFENTDGAGNFGLPQIISLNAPGALSTYASDLDGDGDMDVLSASVGDDKVAWYENTDGLGLFGPQQVITTAADCAYCVQTADLDGDGDLDVISASACDDKVAVYENLMGTPATATPFGAGCGSPPLQLNPITTAILGQQFTATVDAASTPFSFIAFGVSRTNMAGQGPLPIDLSSVGMTGCMLYQSADIIGLPTSPASVPLQQLFTSSIPNTPGLVGQQFFLQAFAIAQGANPLGVLTSNGVEYAVGNQ